MKATKQMYDILIKDGDIDTLKVIEKNFTNFGGGYLNDFDKETLSRIRERISELECSPCLC